MKRIAITQRRVNIGEHQEVRDSLSDDWQALAQHLGIALLPLPNRPEQALQLLESQEVDGIVFSNGESLPLTNEGKLSEGDFAARDRTEQKLLHYAINTQLPVLGICRGCQMIALHAGATLSIIEASQHIAKNHMVSMHFPGWCDSHREVNSYHRYGIQADGAPTFDILAKDEELRIEAFKLPNHPVWGVLWHPERENWTHKSDDGFNHYLFAKVFNL
ncbi:MAG: gamma-glutamyl-gamma-aminobutyrate hydrolase family protein [Aestuariibacter sp.]